MAQSAAFFRGAVLASSVLLGAGYVALRAGWVVVPDEPGDVLSGPAAGSLEAVHAYESILFGSSKSAPVFTPIAPTSGLPSDPGAALPGPVPAPAPTVTTPANSPPLPSVPLMAGSKSITPLLPPKLPTPQQAAPLPKK